MNKEQLEQAIRPYEWYQTINLGHGVCTPGETKEYSTDKLDMMQLPASLAGQRVLDIGCNEGFFSFAAERRGAEEIIGIDNRQGIADKFTLLKGIFGSKAEFRLKSILDLDPATDGEFDLVFFLAVFHHMRYPFLALDRIASVTRGMVVMEIVEAVPKNNIRQAALVRRLGTRGQVRMLPTREMLLEMLEQAGFHCIEILGTHRPGDPGDKRRMYDFSQQRVLLKAHRDTSRAVGTSCIKV